MHTDGAIYAWDAIALMFACYMTTVCRQKEKERRDAPSTHHNRFVFACSSNCLCGISQFLLIFFSPLLYNGVNTRNCVLVCSRCALVERAHRNYNSRKWFNHRTSDAFRSKEIFVQSTFKHSWMMCKVHALVLWWWWWDTRSFRSGAQRVRCECTNAHKILCFLHQIF